MINGLLESVDVDPTTVQDSLVGIMPESTPVAEVVVHVSTER